MTTQAKTVVVSGVLEKKRGIDAVALLAFAPRCSRRYLTFRSGSQRNCSTLCEKSGGGLEGSAALLLSRTRRGRKVRSEREGKVPLRQYLSSDHDGWLRVP